MKRKKKMKIKWCEFIGAENTVLFADARRSLCLNENAVKFFAECNLFF